MVLPVSPIVYPSILQNATNGVIHQNLRVQISGGPPGSTLLIPAAQAWERLRVDARAAGYTLGVTAPFNAYRSLAQQTQVFTARYTTTYTAGVSSSVWQGRRWYLRRGFALAAVPGTSNHGWGLAVDINGIYPALPWMIANAHRYGFSGETNSEPWHWRFHAGDNPPFTTQPPQPPPLQQPEEDDDMTPEQLAHAIGPTAQLGLDGVIRIPLINNKLDGNEMYSIGEALTFIHQEMKMERLKGT